MAILVAPLSRVPEIIAARAPGRVVSLLDPDTGFPETGFGDLHLKLDVHDIALPLPGWKAPCERVVERTIAFVEAWDRASPILIHCWAGISRSTATAFLTACLHNPGADEEDIAWAIRRASPTATPNGRIVALADALLGRSGRMVKAAAAIGRGSPSWPDIEEAVPFEIPATFASKPA